MRGAVILSVDGGNGLDDPDGGRAHPNQELTVRPPFPFNLRLERGT